MFNRSKAIRRVIKVMVACAMLLSGIEYSYGGAFVRCEKGFANSIGPAIDSCQERLCYINSCKAQKLKGAVLQACRMNIRNAKNEWSSIQPARPALDSVGVVKGIVVMPCYIGTR
jgi:hypothetical protein